MSEAETYSQELRWLLAQVADCLRGLDNARLRWRPGFSSANDAATIASHVIGATRAYALELGCGMAVGRDRLAEFQAADRSGLELIEALEGLGAEIEAAFASLRDADLDLAIASTSPHWQAPGPPLGERRRAIVEAIRHVGIHLGELRLTGDLALAGERDSN